MSIVDKTRKILWGRSGNRCAICKHELVVNATPVDDESVVGDECHIVSSLPNGPRYDASYPRRKLDSYENLILLCRVHHKMVDDQADTYTTADILRQMKANHETWVSKKLTGEPELKPLKFRRIKQGIPAYLSRLTTGKEVLNLVMSAYALSTDNDELKSQDEVDLVGGFLQAISDLMEIGNDLELSSRVKAVYDLTDSLAELERAGFFVFGGREVQLMEGGIMTEPSDWPIAILNILRKDNPEIIHVNLDDLKKQNDQPPTTGK